MGTISADGTEQNAIGLDMVNFIKMLSIPSQQSAKG